LKLTSSEGADTINLDQGRLLTADGAGGNDTLNCSTGDEVLLGGLGKDDYYVDSLTDKITEAAGVY
jgi:hypothetical protein